MRSAPTAGTRLQRLWTWAAAAWWPWTDPTVLARLVRRAAALIVVGAVAGFAALLVGDRLVDLDRELLERVEATDGGAALTVAERASHLASFTTVVVAGAALAGWSRRRTGSWWLGQLLTVAIVGALAVVGTVKLVIPRDRPEVAAFEAYSSAFPSGHAARAVVLVGVLGWLVLRSRLAPHRALVWAVGVALALAVAGSRVVLGMHWPTDVLAGAVLGGAWLQLVLPIADEHHLGAPPPP